MGKCHILQHSLLAQQGFKNIISTYPFPKQTGIWNGTVEWKIEWSGECTELQLTHVAAGTVQSRLHHLLSLALLSHHRLCVSKC